MEYSETTTTATATITTSTTTIAATTMAEILPSSISPASSASSSPLILSPCAACKILRRRCVEKCVLAPYFPPTEPLKFTIAHRVFGASNIIKLLQELSEDQRADAVNSMVYEASARLRDPVYGCAGAICQLQSQISELQAQLAKAQAQILNMQCQNANLFEYICENMKIQNDRDHHEPELLPFHENNSAFFFDENVLGVAWEPLWT